MNSQLSRVLLFASLSASTLICSAFAQTTPAQPKSASSAPAAAEKTEWVSAEITKLDAARARVTLKHERIASIKMDAMTMPFKVKDLGLLEGRKVGEKVQFAVKMDDGDLFITQMRSAP
jgi:Cu/Ag efflux protein CusF